MRRNQPYYGNNGDKISGMNIAPMETDLLKVIIQTNLKYKKLYDIKVLGSLFFVVGCLLLIYFQKENRSFPFSPS